MSKSKLAAALAGIIGENAEQVGIKNWLDTGIPELNKALSGSYGDGIPGGRVIEIFGPASSGKTFIATMIMKAAQQAGGIAGFSDHERSFEPKLAASLGLEIDPNVGNFIYKRPQTFEESMQIAVTFCEQVRKQKLIPDDAPLVWVFDSIASMIPHDKLYDEKGNRRKAGDYNMRDKLALAAATSQTYPIVAQFAEDYNMTVLLLNQIRTKPGVMFGDPTCLHGKTKVPFVDGTFATMKEIVENKIAKDVWSFNEQTGQFEAKPIIGWHDNGEIPDVADWIHIESVGVHTRNGRVGLTATPDHKLLTADGKWVTAAELSVGDKLITRRVSLTCEEVTSPEEVEITEIRPLDEKAAKFCRNRYDITVADHHNYMVGSRQNGVIVHNCTPGGNAAEFYASIRVSLGRKMLTNGKTGDDKEIIGQEITANIVKNKVARPFQKAKWRVLFKEGGGATVDVIGSTVDFLLRKGFVVRDGKRIEWEGKKYFEGQLVEHLRADPAAFSKLMSLVPDTGADVPADVADSDTSTELPTD